MESVLMKIDPNELVIDMPLDEANVKVKVVSMRANGLGQPIAVWLHDMRIIDGFHRVEAAKRLDWPVIDAFVKDCSEEEFWDFRIQSAMQHHKITSERLVMWITDCWKTTKWYQTIRQAQTDEIPDERPGKNFRGRPVLSPGEDAKEVAEALWLVLKANPNSYLARRTSAHYLAHGRLPSGLPSGQRELAEWFVVKAAQWQLGFDELARIVFGVFGYVDTPSADVSALQLNLSFNERNRIYGQLARETGASSHRLNRASIERIEREMKGKSPLIRHNPAPSIDEVESVIDAVANRLLVMEGRYKSVAGSASLLVELTHTISDLINRVWPIQSGELAKINPFAEENAALRAEIAKLREERDSFRRALDSKEVSERLLGTTYALSSTDIAGGEA